MLSKEKVVKVLFSFMAFFLLVFSRLSYADWSVGVSVGGPGYYHDDYAHYGWHDHPHYGYHIHRLPPGAMIIWVGGVRYHYYDGLYYRYIGDGDFVLVNPPIGARVDIIPSDFQPVMINGRTYYTDNGVYYLLTEHGYRVVDQPVVYQQPQQVIVAQPVTTVAPQVPVQDGFPVNIPNGNGSFTTVTIKKSGNGYVGPQGEFYASFPSVAQLKAMYVKN